MKQDDVTTDPEVKMAALKLFRASDDFRRAYADWTTAPDAAAAARHRITEAERSIDRARMELGEAQRRAQAHMDPSAGTFDQGL